MITMQEILKSKKLSEQTQVVQDNLDNLLEKLNKLRAEYGKAMIVTSGLRTKEDQIRVYAQKGITDQSKIPFGSKHISGQACDFSDPHGELKFWVGNNVEILEEIGLWCEDFAHTKTWLHVQTVPPASGKRFFKP
jgi:hypothetical protein